MPTSLAGGLGPQRLAHAGSGDSLQDDAAPAPALAWLDNYRGQLPIA